MIDTIKRWRWWLFAIILLGGLVALWQNWRTYQENSQDAHILAAARQYGMDAALIKAVVWRESEFNPKAKGGVGEVGLMQISELAAEEWAEAERLTFFQHHQLFDPGKNTRAGAWYLRKLLRRYSRTDNPLPYALADYNAGRSHVLRWNKGAAATNSALFISQITFPSTKHYVRTVMKRYDRYRSVFPPKTKRRET